MSELAEMRAKVDRIAEKVDRLAETGTRTDTNVTWIRDAMDHQVKRSDDHEKRIRWLERWQWLISGGAAVVGWLLGGYSGWKH